MGLYEHRETLLVDDQRVVGAGGSGISTKCYPQGVQRSSVHSGLAGNHCLDAKLKCAI